MSSTGLLRRNGMTFRIRLRPADRDFGLPRGWELSVANLEPGVQWSYLSLWKSRRDAVEAAECFCA